MATSTFYPAVDGWLQQTQGGDGNTSEWNACHDATSSAYLDSTSTTGQVASQRTDHFYISRIFYSFNTSIIPVGSKIVSANIALYVTSTAVEVNDGKDWINIVEGRQASATALANADFNDCGSAVDNPTEGSTRIDISTTGIGAYSFDLNASGLSWIIPGSYSKFGLREGHDCLDSMVTTDTNKGVRATVAMVEHATVSYRPLLTVVYYPPGGSFIYNLV